MFPAVNSVIAPAASVGEIKSPTVLGSSEGHYRFTRSCFILQEAADKILMSL